MNTKKSIIVNVVVFIVLPLVFLFSCQKKEEGKLNVSTKPVTEITTSSAKSGGIVTATGEYTGLEICGICWSKTPSPTVNDFFTTDNMGFGEFTAIMKNLDSGTKYYVRAYAKTKSGVMYGEEMDFMTEALPEESLSVFTNDITEITATTAKCGGEVVASGKVVVVARGVCWSTSSHPSVENDHSSDGQGLGAFLSNMTQLEENTSYFVRAYATTESGTTYYGEEKSFTTETNGDDGGDGDDEEVTVIVYTTEVTEITTSSARCGGVVTANGEIGITERGVCWSTNPEPSLTYYASAGSGLGSFSSILTGLEENTQYYVWAYATTDSDTTYYGDRKSFTTESEVINIITVVTKSVSDVTSISAKGGGEISCTGDCTVNVRGVCWSTTHNPEVSGTHTANGQGIGSFVSDIEELLPNTTYFVRAYAMGDSEITYGNEVTFSTLSEVPSEIEIIEITYNSVKVRVAPSFNVAYYTAKIVGIGDAIQHNVTETELTFDNLSEQTEYSFEFSFYRSNGNLINTEVISATTLEEPYEYAYVTVTSTDIQAGYIELKFEPSANTAYYCFNQGPNLTSTSHNTGTITKKFNYLQPDTEYVFSVVAYDNNGVAGEVIHPTFRTAPAPYANYLRVGNNFYQMNTAQIATEVLANGWGQKTLIIRGTPSTYWIKLMYLCYSSELNLVWNAGTYTIQGNSSYHQYNCMYNRGSNNPSSMSEGTFTLSKSGSVYTIDIASERDLVWAHFSGVMSN